MPTYKKEELRFDGKNLVIIIGGLPGVGKTTTGCSAPDPVLIDCDEGVVRVNPAHRTDTCICATYEELLADIKTFDGKYKTVVIDTGGALVDMLKDWAMRNEPTASKKSGGFSQQGYGFVKAEFLRLFAELRKKFNVVVLFHVQKDKVNEDVFYDIICEGSAKSLVYMPADLAAYMHIVNGERYLGFTPTANYNAKSAFGIKGLVKVPELAEGDENNFLTKLFDQVRANIASENTSTEEKEKMYNAAMEAAKKVVDNVKKPEDVKSAAEAIAKFKHSLTSKEESKALLKAKLDELGIEWDKAKKAYVYKVPDNA